MMDLVTHHAPTRIKKNSLVQVEGENAYLKAVQTHFLQNPALPSHLAGASLLQPRVCWEARAGLSPRPRGQGPPRTRPDQVGSGSSHCLQCRLSCPGCTASLAQRHRDRVCGMTDRHYSSFHLTGMLRSLCDGKHTLGSSGTAAPASMRKTDGLNQFIPASHGQTLLSPEVKLYPSKNDVTHTTNRSIHGFLISKTDKLSKIKYAKY